jgi:hypothetical protein
MGMGWAIWGFLDQQRITRETRLREAKIHWRTLAQEAESKGEYFKTAMYAARALGFRGCGYERLNEKEKREFDRKCPPLVDSLVDPSLHRELQALINGPVSCSAQAERLL